MTTPKAIPPPLERKSLQTLGLHAIFLSLLLGILPSLDAAYGYAFQAAGNQVLGNPGGGLQVEYHWAPPHVRDERGEIEMRGFFPGQQNPAWASGYSVRDRGYIPTTVLIALIVVTPATRTRRALGAVLGAVSLNAFYLAQTGLLAATLFASADPTAIAMGDALAGARPAAERLFGSALPRYAAVFAIWAVAAAPARGLDLSAASAWFRGATGAGDRS